MTKSICEVNNIWRQYEQKSTWWWKHDQRSAKNFKTYVWPSRKATSLSESKIEGELTHLSLCCLMKKASTIFLFVLSNAFAMTPIWWNCSEPSQLCMKADCWKCNGTEHSQCIMQSLLPFAPECMGIFIKDTFVIDINQGCSSYANCAVWYIACLCAK